MRTNKEWSHEITADAMRRRTKRRHDKGDHSTCSIEKCKHGLRTIRDADDIRPMNHYGGIRTAAVRIEETPDIYHLGELDVARCHYCAFNKDVHVSEFTKKGWLRKAWWSWWVGQEHYCLRGSIKRIRWV